jgi:hypothetical protein
MVEPFNAPVNRVATIWHGEPWLNRCLMPLHRRDSISRGGQKARHEHDEDDTQAK